jgi:hypothetical protein
MLYSSEQQYLPLLHSQGGGWKKSYKSYMGCPFRGHHVVPGRKYHFERCTPATGLPGDCAG